ncbi:MAG: hypothetical protein ACYDA9_20745, partial [Terriglobia bacterium]
NRGENIGFCQEPWQKLSAIMAIPPATPFISMSAIPPILSSYTDCSLSELVKFRARVLETFCRGK